MTTAKEPYQLGKHMAKLLVEDTGVVILRNRYLLKSEQMKTIRESVNLWQKATGTKLQVLLVPHDFDVFAFERSPWTTAPETPPSDSSRSASPPATP